MIFYVTTALVKATFVPIIIITAITIIATTTLNIIAIIQHAHTPCDDVPHNVRIGQKQAINTQPIPLKNLLNMLQQHPDVIRDFLVASTDDFFFFFFFLLNLFHIFFFSFLFN